MYRRRRELWNLGRRSLARHLFLGTSTSRTVTKVHRARYTLPLSSLGAKLLDDQRSDIVQDLYILFTLNTTCNAFPFIFLHSGHPYIKEDEVSKKQNDGRYLLRQVVSLCARFSVVGLGPSPQAARRLKVTKLWKDLSGKARAWSI